MTLVSIPTVALTSMVQCAKTHEVQHTPTPVRVTIGASGAHLRLGAAGATREGTAGPAPGAGRVVQLLSYPEH